MTNGYEKIIMSVMTKRHGGWSTGGRENEEAAGVGKKARVEARRRKYKLQNEINPNEGNKGNKVKPSRPINCFHR